jgi:hypothetical protein
LAVRRHSPRQIVPIISRQIRLLYPDLMSAVVPQG